MSDLGLVLEAAGYRISGGAEYQWSCYPDARYLDLESDFGAGSILFSTVDQTVYAVEISSRDYEHNYRWINPEFRDDYELECERRGVDANIAYDDQMHSDTFVFEDILTKVHGVLNGEEFDEDVQIPLELTEQSLAHLAVYAHQRDITINEAIVEILTNTVTRLEADAAEAQPRCPVTDPEIYAGDCI